MVATLIAGCCTKLSKEQNVEACDATGFNSSNTVWFITKTYNLNTVPVNNSRLCIFIPAFKLKTFSFIVRFYISKPIIIFYDMYETVIALLLYKHSGNGAGNFSGKWRGRSAV